MTDNEACEIRNDLREQAVQLEAFIADKNESIKKLVDEIAYLNDSISVIDAKIADAHADE